MKTNHFDTHASTHVDIIIHALSLCSYIMLIIFIMSWSSPSLLSSSSTSLWAILMSSSRHSADLTNETNKQIAIVALTHLLAHAHRRPHHCAHSTIFIISHITIIITININKCYHCSTGIIVMIFWIPACQQSISSLAANRCLWANAVRTWKDACMLKEHKKA